MIYYNHWITYLLYRFGYVEYELNKAWENSHKKPKGSKTKKSKNQKTKTTKESRLTEDDKTPIVDGNLDSKGQSKSHFISRLEESMDERQNPKQHNANKSEDPDQMDTLSKIIEKISPNSTKSIEKMIPEMLRYQFFLRRETDESDCLMKTCDMLIHNYHSTLHEGDELERAGKEMEVIS